MGEEFYCILKLISGEEIFSLTSIDENDGDPIIILQNPVVMKSHNNHNGSYVKIKPWVELSSDDLFFIKLDKVITMTESNDDKIIKIYEHYLKSDSVETYKPGGKVSLSTEMGYVSSVEDARSKLENLYNNKES